MQRRTVLSDRLSAYTVFACPPRLLEKNNLESLSTDAFNHLWFKFKQINLDNYSINKIFCICMAQALDCYYFYISMGYYTSRLLKKSLNVYTQVYSIRKDSNIQTLGQVKSMTITLLKNHVLY